MNEEMESEQTELESIPDHLEVSEDESADEAVPINIGKRKPYNDTMGQDIENIGTYETRTKVNIHTMETNL